MLSLLAWQLTRQFVGATCAVLALLFLRLLFTDLTNILYDELAAVLIVSAFMGACVSWFVGTFASILQTIEAFGHNAKRIVDTFSTKLDTPTPLGTPSPTKSCKLQVGRMLSALKTIRRDASETTLKDRADKAYIQVQYWAHFMDAFDPEEQVVISNMLVYCLRGAFEAFVKQQLATPNKDLKVEALLKSIDTEFADRQASSASFTFEFVDEASYLHKVMLYVDNQLGSLANHARFAKKLDTIMRKLNDLPYWLGMFGEADKLCVWNTIKTLLKPDLVEVLSMFVESQDFINSKDTAKHAQILVLLNTLRTNEKDGQDNMDFHKHTNKEPSNLGDEQEYNNTRML
jgi:hypothetical protein